MKALDINSYTADGFTKVCDVRHYNKSSNRFRYVNINKKLMYSDHRSWVYMIVSDQTVMKIGETGNPLGIKKANSNQPILSTKCRLGRLAFMDCNTDGHIRRELYEDCKEKKVSIWARPCEYQMAKVTVNGVEVTATSTIHKDLELLFLDHVYSNVGQYPVLNSGRK